MTAKHRSVNNVLWMVVAGRIRTGRGPDVFCCWMLDNPALACTRVDAEEQEDDEDKTTRPSLYTKHYRA